MKLLFNRTFKQTALLGLLLEELKASKSFDMCYWSYSKGTNPAHPCGTPACIGGHLAFILESMGIKDNSAYERQNNELMVVNSEFLGHYIGLTREQAKAMFRPYYDTHKVSFMAKKGQKGYISKKRAVIMLERFIKTNKVNWDPK